MHVPNKSYNGYIGEVRFERGVGVFTDIELAKKIAGEFGYELVGNDIAAVNEKIAEKAPAQAPKKRNTRKKAEPKDGE